MGGQAPGCPSYPTEDSILLRLSRCGPRQLGCPACLWCEVSCPARPPAAPWLFWEPPAQSPA